MDNVELWLQANDPAYADHARDWKHVWLGEHNYRAPREELTRKDFTNILIAAERTGRIIGHIETAAGSTTCAKCGTLFDTYKSDHRFCSELCRTAHRRTYMRELMRRRRADQLSAAT